MCPVLNLQCQLTTNYFNLEFLSDFFYYYFNPFNLCLLLCVLL